MTPEEVLAWASGAPGRPDLTLLASDNPDLRAESADCLGKIVGYRPRRPEFREVLQQRLTERIVVEEFGWVLSTALQSLGLVGVAEDEELLSKYADSEDRQVRRQSRWAIERLRTKPW